MIIFNEREYVEQIMTSNKVPGHTSIDRVIRYVCQYINDTMNLSPKAFNKKVFERLREFDFPITYYDEARDSNKVKRISLKVRRGEYGDFFNFQEIPITVPEMEIIQKASSDEGKKLMLTYYVLAKAQREPSGWVGYSDTEIFKRADLHMSEDERCSLIYELQKRKLIMLHPRIDKNPIMVRFIDGDLCMTVTNFEHIGNAYVDRYREGWKMCEHCGRLIHIGKAKTSGQPRKYCKDCAPKVDAKKARERMKLNRERSIYSNGTNH